MAAISCILYEGNEENPFYKVSYKQRPRPIYMKLVNAYIMVHFLRLLPFAPPPSLSIEMPSAIVPLRDFLPPMKPFFFVDASSIVAAGGIRSRTSTGPALTLLLLADLPKPS